MGLKEALRKTSAEMLLNLFVKPAVQKEFVGVTAEHIVAARLKGVLLWDLIELERRKAARDIAQPHKWVEPFFTYEVILAWLRESNPDVAVLVTSDAAWQMWMTQQCEYIRRSLLG